MELPVMRATLVWLLILVLAVLNGAFRDMLVSPWLGDPAGHIISTLILSSLILTMAWLTAPWLRPDTAQTAWGIGAFWFVLTLAFEFIAGHWLFGSSWDKLLADYNVLRGRIWPLVLLITLAAPAIAFHFRLRRPA